MTLARPADAARGGSDPTPPRAVARIRAWCVFLLGVLTIITTLDVAFEASSFLMARGYLWQTVKTLFAVAGATLCYLLVIGAGIRQLPILLRTAPALAAFAGAVLTLRSSPAERFHFIEYGVLYLLALRAVCVDVRSFAAYLLAFVATVIASGIDELAQHTSAYRTGDWSDLRMNACAALLSALIMVSLFARDPTQCRFVHLRAAAA